MPMNPLLKLALTDETQKISSPSAKAQEKKVPFSRMQWACRRGMLELDLLLSRFLESQYSQLSEEECIQLMTLLQEEDTSLYAWLMQQSPAPVPFQALVKRIIHHE